MWRVVRCSAAGRLSAVSQPVARGILRTLGGVGKSGTCTREMKRTQDDGSENAFKEARSETPMRFVRDVCQNLATRQVVDDMFLEDAAASSRQQLGFPNLQNAGLDREKLCMELLSSHHLGSMDPVPVTLIGRLLDSMVALGSDIDMNSQDQTVRAQNDAMARFASDHELPISSSAFVHRIERYSRISSSCFLVAIIYLRRLGCIQMQAKQPFFLAGQGRYTLTRRSVQRLLLTAVMIASKVLERSIVDGRAILSKHWAQIGGIEVAELNTLELTMLLQLDFRCHVGAAEFLQLLDTAKAAAELGATL